MTPEEKLRALIRAITQRLNSENVPFCPLDYELSEVIDAEPMVDLCFALERDTERRAKLMAAVDAEERADGIFRFTTPINDIYDIAHLLWDERTGKMAQPVKAAPRKRRRQA